eukprot:m.175075 g.175075  ORF g.175075 m.175075 type:complete len:50 (-) comp31796_c0_seq2:22-171(-)
MKYGNVNPQRFPSAKTDNDGDYIDDDSKLPHHGYHDDDDIDDTGSHSNN